MDQTFSWHFKGRVSERIIVAVMRSCVSVLYFLRPGPGDEQESVNIHIQSHQERRYVHEDRLPWKRVINVSEENQERYKDEKASRPGNKNTQHSLTGAQNVDQSAV